MNKNLPQIVTRDEIIERAYLHLSGGKSKRIDPALVLMRAETESMQARDLWIFQQAAMMLIEHGIARLVAKAERTINLLMQVDESYANDLLTSDMFCNDEDVASAMAHGLAVLAWYKLCHSGAVDHMFDFGLAEVEAWMNARSNVQRMPVQFSLFEVSA